MVFGVTDVQHDDLSNSYRASRPEVGAYVSVGNKFIDMVSLADKESKVSIPLTNPRDKVQIILKQLDRNERKLGSISIPVHLFRELKSNTVYSHWVTLFDYLEDDEYDGDLGVDDTETPSARITYYLDSQSPSRSSKPATTSTTTTRTEESKGGSKRVITNTRTTTVSSYSTRYSPDKAAKTTTTTTAYRSDYNSGGDPQPEVLNVRAQPISSVNEYVSQDRSDAERYSVRVLRSDLTNNTRGLVNELQDQQSHLFNEEDRRIEQLANLDKLHRELQGEHVQDQITGFNLTRKDQEITCDYDVRKAAFGEQIKALSSRIEDVELAHAQTKGVEAEAARENQRVNQELNKTYDTKASGLTPLSKDLRTENVSLRKAYTNSNNELGKESQDTNKVTKQHEDVITAYNSTIDKYNDLLLKVELARKEAEADANVVVDGISKEDGDNITLRKTLDHTTNEKSSLSASAARLKTQLGKLDKSYTVFLNSLIDINNSQNREIQSLNDAITQNGEACNQLSRELKNQSDIIDKLHEEVDRENATAMNERLSRLIDTLVVIDSKRRCAQDSLEDGQTNWSIKLRLFLDEASRRSRETAKSKRMQEIEQKIQKIDRLTREIYDLQTEIDRLEARVYTDSNRGVVNAELKKELDGLKLKQRWAEEERNQTYNELEILLQLLRDRDIREAQRSEIKELLDEIEYCRRQISERNKIIRELEDEIGELDGRINELQALIDAKNKEIDELTRLLNQRIARLNELQKALGGAIKEANYRAAKGDLVDEMLANYLNIVG